MLGKGPGGRGPGAEQSSTPRPAACLSRGLGSRGGRVEPGLCRESAEHLLLGATLLSSPLRGHQCELPGDPDPQFTGTQGLCDPLCPPPSTACPPPPGAPAGALTLSPQGSLDQGHSMLIGSQASPFWPLSQGSSSRPRPSCPGTFQALLMLHALARAARAPSSRGQGVPASGLLHLLRGVPSSGLTISSRFQVREASTQM